MSEPTLAGFISFLRNTAGIPADVLPSDDSVIAMAYAVALEIVYEQLAQVSELMYSLAVYNLGTSNVLNYAQDADDAPPVQGSDPQMAYFAYTRAKFNMLGFVSGVIQSSADQGTSNSMVVQEAAKNFTLADLQYLKDPFGRKYLSIAQRSGTLWGLT